MKQQQTANTHTIHIFLQASNYNEHYSPMPEHLRYCPFDVALLSQESSQTRAPAVQRNSARFWPTTTAVDAGSISVHAASCAHFTDITIVG